MKFDTLVVGAGVVGTAIALHLQMRGRSVVLVDRKAPGNETSYGNAGLIQREGVYPYAFPRAPAAMWKLASNRTPHVRYHTRAMPKLAPFLWRYWQNSAPRRHAEIARAYSTLIEHSVSEHRLLAGASGVSNLLTPSGWMRVFRTTSAFDKEAASAALWHREYGINADLLDSDALQKAEPDLAKVLIGAVRYTDVDAVSDPGGLVAAYARHFEQLGGQVLTGDAATFKQDGAGWKIQTLTGEVHADSAVIALGPWAKEMGQRLGYDLPLAVKRGYHMHYAPKVGARLSIPTLDAEQGYLLAPMARGIRLTTGIELAAIEAPKSPVQLAEVEPVARALFPLGERVDAEPWLGRRPCTPDMMPIIGPAPRHEKLWFAFGHAHHGLTLGAITGRIVAELVTGEKPFVDVTPFRADRF